MFLFVTLGRGGINGSDKGTEILDKLMEGNQRFLSGKPVNRDISELRRKELSQGQLPLAIVVSCSDSRVSPEIIFDQGLGDLFVIRVAGNVIDKVTLGSIEYAVKNFHTPLLILLGHTHCGAVSEAVSLKGKLKGNIGALIKKIIPAVKVGKKKGKTQEEILNYAIRENLALQERYLIKKSPIVRHFVKKEKLKIIKAIYYLESGKVEIIP